MTESPALKLAGARLDIISGEERGESVLLDQPKLIIGRELDCGLRLSDPLCSRYHAAIVCDPYTIRIRDLGSLNGTLVNGQKVETAITLCEGDEIRIGSTRLIVRRQGANDSKPSSGTTVVYSSKDTTKILF